MPELTPEERRAIFDEELARREAEKRPAGEAPASNVDADQPLELQGPAHTTKASRRMLVAAGLAVVGLLAVVFLSKDGEGQTISGTFTIMEPISETPGGSCSGEGGYDDIDEGLQVEVRNGKNDLLANGDLGPGTRVSLIAATLGADGKTEIGGKEIDLSGIGDDSDLSYCQFEFSVEDIPKSDFYSISVGRRGDLSYSHEEMEENDWTVGFTIGS